MLAPLIGRSGWLSCIRLTLNALETEDRLVLAGVSDDGTALNDTQCRRLFDLPAIQGAGCSIPIAISGMLDQAQADYCQALLEETATRNGRWFDVETDKLDHWAEDRRASLKVELAELDEALKEAKKAARLAPTLPDKLERQRESRTLEAKCEEAWRAYEKASREIDRQKDTLLDEISRRLQQNVEQKVLFTLRWALV